MRGEIQHGIGGEERYRHIILSKASSGGRSYLYHTFQAKRGPDIQDPGPSMYSKRERHKTRGQ